MATQKLNLTRDQLATFLKNHEQIKQFERLFQIADEVSPSSDTTGISIQAGNADAAANEALAQIVRLAQDAATNSGAADQKAVQALDALGRIANALEMLATAPVIQNNNSVVTDYIDLRDYGWNPAYRIARVWFGPTGTLEVGMGNGQITQQVGEEFFRYGKASAPIPAVNLQAVYKTGVVGGSGVVQFAPTIAGLTRADQIMGIATEPLGTNDFGRVTIMGVVRNVNTTGSVYGEVWSDNDDIWYNPVTGGLTKIEPVAPNMKLKLGTVINAATGSGSFFVSFGAASTLGGTDSNVQFGPLSNTDLIQYDSALQYWKNVAPSTVLVGTSNNLAGGAVGSVPYQSAASTTTFLGIGAALQVLKVNAGATAPEWVSGAALSKVDDTNVTLTLGGTPTAALLSPTSLTLGWNGQLSIARGGTGQSTQQTAINALAGSTTSGQFLRGNGTNVVMSTIQFADLPASVRSNQVLTWLSM